jgi:hypothetical protein
VSQETRKRLLVELAKINKKPNGKRVKLDALIVKLLPKLTSQDVTELQQQSLTGKDRMEQSHKAYCAKFGQISMDEFLAKLSEQAVSHFSSENVADSARGAST